PTFPIRVAWEGDLWAVHSLALVNRELCLRLAERGQELTLLPSDAPEIRSESPPLPALLAERVDGGPPTSGGAAVHVRHQWPPVWTPPREGRWVLIQPWEYGSLPREWLGPLSREVDEVWVPSQSVRDAYVRGGVPADRVQVVPNGVDVTRFHPGA